MLTVIEAYPVQYHSPIYRALQSQFGVPLTVIYGSDLSVRGYHDREFGTNVAWDMSLLEGYKSIFLSRESYGHNKKTSNILADGLRKTLQSISSKVLLIHGYTSLFDRIACYEAWRSGNSIFFRGETTDHARKRYFAKELIRNSVLRRAYHYFTRLLFIGKRSYEHYKRLGCPDEKLVFSPYCVDVSPFETDETARLKWRLITRQQLSITDDEIVLIFSGKLSQRKGPDLILQAIKQLQKNSDQKFVAIFLGSGKLLDELKGFTLMERSVKAFFLGFQTQSQLSRYFHAADLFVMPSREGETWGLVVNEALHHGVPCVVSDAVGCTPDLIELGNTGNIFSAGSVEGLTAMIRKSLVLIRSDATRNVCRQKIKNYTIEAAAKGIAEAYNQICKR